MTREGPRKKVDTAFSSGRRRNAEDFLKAAQDGIELADEGQNAAPIMSNIVNAAIAFCDAITAKVAAVANTQDHAAAPRLLREVLRERLPGEIESRFRRILGEKDSAQYGARPFSLVTARQRMADLRQIATWAADELDR